MNEKLYIGVDVGASNIRIGLGDENELYSDTNKIVPTEQYWSEEGLVDLIVELLEENEVSQDSIEAIGIGVPGLINVEEKKIEYAHALDELSFSKLSELGIDFSIENDANAAVMGEKLYGEGKELENIVTVILGSGIGGGVYYSGNLLGSEKDGRSPEPAGINVDNDTTWDQSVGGENMPGYMKSILNEETIPEDATAEEIFRKARENSISQQHIDTLTELNARGISTLIDLYAPELITFSGSVATNNLEFMQNSFEKAAELSVNPEPEMKISELGNKLGLYGALAVAQRKE
ncbi:ROK family protein [Candidatus Nanosalina sp. VS9-1]|uniref:ROK family protein n=1 Tax=Candidatus Nanosalina sp. VS9-1 TaxID=3388566 RepID=UPI0039E027A3